MVVARAANSRFPNALLTKRFPGDRVVLATVTDHSARVRVLRGPEALSKVKDAPPHLARSCCSIFTEDKEGLVWSIASIQCYLI